MPISLKQRRTLKYLGRVMKHLPVELMEEFSDMLSGTDEEWDHVEEENIPWNGTDLTRLKDVVEQLIARHGHDDKCDDEQRCTCWVGEVL